MMTVPVVLCEMLEGAAWQRAQWALKTASPSGCAVWVCLAAGGCASGFVDWDFDAAAHTATVESRDSMSRE
jgi:hypothetical protein